jgi:hypothetical protein
VHPLHALAGGLREPAHDAAAVGEVDLERAVRDAGAAGVDHLAREAARHELRLDGVGDRVDVVALGRGDEHLLAGAAEREAAGPQLDAVALADGARRLVDLQRLLVAVPGPLEVPQPEATVVLLLVDPRHLGQVDAA